MRQRGDAACLRGDLERALAWYQLGLQQQPELIDLYEKRGTVAGAVAQFDLNGNFLRELASSAKGVPLDAPWGVVLAPAAFGKFGGGLLVGNKDDGHILAFDPTTGAFLGQLLDINGNPLINSGLWALTFGNGARGTDPNTLYFVAGILGEAHGLFGAINAVPEPSTLALFALGGLGLAGLRPARPHAGSARIDEGTYGETGFPP